MKWSFCILSWSLKHFFWQSYHTYAWIEKLKCKLYYFAFYWMRMFMWNLIVSLAFRGEMERQSVCVCAIERRPLEMMWWRGLISMITWNHACYIEMCAGKCKFSSATAAIIFSAGFGQTRSKIVHDYFPFNAFHIVTQKRIWREKVLLNGILFHFNHQFHIPMPNGVDMTFIRNYYNYNT